MTLSLGSLFFDVLSSLFFLTWDGWRGMDGMLQVASPTCIWALSLDGRVFGVLLLLESWDALIDATQTPS